MDGQENKAMAIKKRTISSITIGTDGATTTGSKTVSLGAPYGAVRKIEVKGDDGNVEATATIVVTDADGRIVFSDSGLDFGADDATVKQTEQGYSTVGLGIYLAPVETEVIDRLGDPAADTEGLAGGILAASPLTVALSSGTDGDVYRVHVFVEV
jgi:hypothetical protein